MSLAGGRAPRKTAGNRLSGLLEAEEEDEFYQTTYGGFTEARAGPRKREGINLKGEKPRTKKGAGERSPGSWYWRWGGQDEGINWSPSRGSPQWCWRGQEWRSCPKDPRLWLKTTVYFLNCISQRF